MVVDSILGFDSELNFLYFRSTNFDPTERHIYRLITYPHNIYFTLQFPCKVLAFIYRAGTADSADPDPVCLTCDFPETCRYVSASYSSTGKFYIETCSGPDIPSYRLKSTDGATGRKSFCNEDWKLLSFEIFSDILLEDNADVREKLSVKQLPTRNFIEFPVTDGYSKENHNTT